MKVKVESFARDLVSYHVPSDLRNFENVKHLAGTFPGAEADEIRRLLIIKKKKKKERVVIIFEARKEEDEKEEEEEYYCIWSKATHPAA